MHGRIIVVWVAVFFAAMLPFGNACAEDTAKVTVSAVPTWVVPVVPPVTRSGDGAIEFRLVDIQTRVDGDALHQHFHQIAKILAPEGLALLGNFGVAWQPGISTAHVHIVSIRRNGVAIDVLRDGSDFQVLRREANLEKLQIDGSLTALLPINDLRVGDEIETAWTLDTRNPVLAGNSENRQFFGPGPTFDRLFLRYSWPKGRTVQLRIGDALPKAAPLKSMLDAGFVIDKTDFTAPPLPEGVPTRFARSNAIDLTEFADWRAVAATMHPLYEAASRTVLTSSINSEIRRIAAMTFDPSGRATEALKTVQSQVRYFARMDGLGGYKPEMADAVWAGRVGDCKGKTVLLLALLRGLGIDAEAALVSSSAGDGMDAALPMPLRFDHVIVRAIIAGKPYWLDGTRLGDRSIDKLVVPDFKWALPLSAKSTALVAMVAVDPVEPQEEWRLDLDSRAGIDKPATATGVAIFRGDRAGELRAALTVMPAANRETFLRNTWTGRHDWIKVDRISFSYGEAEGTLRLDMVGTGDMDWNDTGETKYNNYEANRSTLGQNLVSKRVETLQAVAPVYVAQRFEATHQTILLPDGGRGFKLDGGTINTMIGGVHYRRTVTLVGERFDMTTTTQSSAGEMSYADAVAADKATDELVKKRLFITMPVKAAATVATFKPKAVSTPVTLRGKAARAEFIAGSMSDDDYPPDAIRANASGTTTVSFDIGPDGRVGECGIAESSGSISLDDKSCALVRERFTYKPARGPDGSATSETRTQRITWRIPEGSATIAPYDVTYRYVQGADGVSRDCTSSGTPKPPVTSTEQCTKAGNGIIMKDKNGKPVAAIITQRHSQTIELVPTDLPNSGNPR